MNKSKSLTTGDIAKYCDVNLRTVIRWIERGSLKAYKLPGRGNNRILLEDFLTFLDAHNMPVPEEFSGNNTNILICDDELPFARSIQRQLNMAGYTTLIAQDGFQAGMLLSSYMPKLMTLDLSMPGLNGFDVLRIVKQQKDLENVKILVISALPEAELERAKEAGADAYLAKPYEQDVLLKTVRSLIGDN